MHEYPLLFEAAAMGSDPDRNCAAVPRCLGLSGVDKLVRYGTVKPEPEWAQNNNCRSKANSQSLRECGGSTNAKTRERIWLISDSPPFSAVNGLLGGVTLPLAPFLFYD